MQTRLIVTSDKQISTTKLRCPKNNLNSIRLAGTPFQRYGFCLLMSVIICLMAGFQAKAADQLSMPEIDTATTQRSEKGFYNVTIDSVAEPIVINTIHEWRLTVLSTDSTPIDGLAITIDGGMPMHDHGLPTAPRVTEPLGRGQYRVEGFKFQMPGHWVVTFNLTNSENVSDSVTFNLVL